MKEIIDQILKSRPVTHASFWIVMVFTLAYHGSLFGGAFKNNLINMLCIMPIQMLAAYFLVYVQLARWLMKGKWLIFVISLLSTMYVSSVLARLIIIYIAEPLIGYNGIDESLIEILSDPIYLIKIYLPSVYLPVLIFFLIKMTKDRFSQQHKLITLEKEKHAAELSFLKAQMNPHFLFNTLNNIYALAQNKSENTPELILKLSEILGYTIYECQEEHVSLVKEWELIENYIDLESLRHNNRLTIIIEKEINNTNAKIAPLILITLVENAFKFALKSHHESPEVKIQLQEVNNRLTFEVLNSKPKLNISLDDKHQGIGTENVRRQLELQYKNKHQFTMEEGIDWYHVNLVLQL